MHHFSQGINTKQAHKAIPEGHYEEEQGHLGFFGPVSHIIRKQPSTRWTNIEGPLKPRLYDLAEYKAQDTWQRLLYNQSTSIGYQHVSVKTPDQLFGQRNADGDIIYFCHQGAGQILSEYGLLDYRRGHYVVIPKAVTFTVNATEPTTFLTIENRTSHYEEPDRGIVGRHAVYDVNAIGKPNLEALHATMDKIGANITEINIKHLDENTKYSFADNIYDVVGWKGDLFPYTLHTDDMMPLMSHRAHLPPSAHSTFVARDFVICTFLPRPLEHDDDALKVPFYHQNIDYDEVLFYHDGDFFSRDNLHAGMMTFHPAGFPHGPHPKAVEGVKGKTETKEYAVMIDTRWPLLQDGFMSQVEIKDYWKSWQTK